MMNRRAFTLLELLLAMVIGTFVLTGGYALLASIGRMDSGFSTRLDTTMRLAFVQRTVARATHSVVAAPESFDPQSAAIAASEEQEKLDLFDEVQDRDEFFELLRQLNADDRDETTDSIIEERPVPSAPARVRMGHLSDDEEWEYRDEAAGEGVRRLELLLTRAPFGDQSRGRPIRGAFDIVPVPSREGDRWRFQWTPIAPEGKPTILLDDLTLAEWSLTDSEGAFDEFAAYTASDLPWALRVTLWTGAGEKVDWMFAFGAASTTSEPL